MKTTVQKWGNSLALRLPKALADEARIREGAKVELVCTPDGVLVKARRKPRYRLADLLAGVTPENVHAETDWGISVGREVVTGSLQSGAIWCGLTSIRNRAANRPADGLPWCSPRYLPVVLFVEASISLAPRFSGVSARPMPSKPFQRFRQAVRNR